MRPLALIIALFLLCGDAVRANNESNFCTKAREPGFQTEADDERPYLCQLPQRIKKNVPELYWWSPEKYVAWLKTFSLKPTATLNLGNDLKESHRLANAYVLDPNACHIYSSISPSVQKNAPYLKNKRTWITLDSQDLLLKCEEIGQTLAKNGEPLCSVIELAGHSTQSIGLDTVFGIDERKGKKVITPSKDYLKSLGKCLKTISSYQAPVFFSTCGGDIEVVSPGLGPTHYWPGKEKRQQELADLFQMPVISGIGFVDGTPEGGVTCDNGWHLSEP